MNRKTVTASELFDILQGQQILICQRSSNNLICPTTIRVGKFEDIIDFAHVIVHQHLDIRFNGVGIYILKNDGTTKNIHKQIKRLIEAGFLKLETVPNKYYNLFYKLKIA